MYSVIPKQFDLVQCVLMDTLPIILRLRRLIIRRLRDLGDMDIHRRRHITIIIPAPTLYLPTTLRALLMNTVITVRLITVLTSATRLTGPRKT